jgi:hypothetical protein
LKEGASMDLLRGNANEAPTHGTGWMLGFSEWSRRPGSDLLYVPKDLPLSGLCLKWFEHPDGHDSGAPKPVSEGRTISLLVSQDSLFRIDFCESADFAATPVESVLLSRHGDFVIWGPGLHHRWACVRRSTVLTVRWSPHEGPV